MFLSNLIHDISDISKTYQVVVDVVVFVKTMHGTKKKENKDFEMRLIGFSTAQIFPAYLLLCINSIYHDHSFLKRKAALPYLHCNST